MGHTTSRWETAGVCWSPIELRRSLGWDEGTRLHLLETDAGVLVMTRDQLRAYVRRDLAGLDLVAELLDERGAAARRDDTTVT